jgi:hypothetical protein
MRLISTFLLLLAGLAAANAQTITSAYTDLDSQRDCTIYEAAGTDDGDWANMVCIGYKGYPVILQYGDARESIFYGFPPQGEQALRWESFDGFNTSGPKIEWRIASDGDVEVPFATIHRWSIPDPESEDGTKKTEVLVIEKVGQVDARDGCAVGLVVATGNPRANETARRIADEQARDFACGADERVMVEGSVPMPSFSVQETE